MQNSWGRGAVRILVAITVLANGCTMAFGAVAITGRLDRGLKVRPMTMPDAFFEHAKPEDQLEAAHLTASHIVTTAISALGGGAVGGSRIRMAEQIARGRRD